MNKDIKKILITGGAGYVGSVTVPKLIAAGYQVTVYDLYMYGTHVFENLAGNPNLKQVKGDIRDQELLNKELAGMDAVIHLACISNDPSYELNPHLGRSINFDAFEPLVTLSKKNGVSRFIYASSSSVYGVKQEDEVTEELSLEPLTDYSKFKALCEDVLLKHAEDNFTCLIIRPATVCGYSPRLRLDLSVNILTNHAINNNVIQVFGGAQKRPNIHIEDMADLYLNSLKWPHEKIHKKIYNVGYENHTLDEIAMIVKKEIGDSVEIKHVPTNDLRSYCVSSKKIANELGFKAKHSLGDAVRDLREAFNSGLIPDSMNDPKYFNIKTMQQIDLK